MEILARILSNLSNPFTLYHVERVCPLWREIVRFLEQARGLKFRNVKVLQRLRCVESLNEAAGIQQEENRGFHHKFKEGKYKLQIYLLVHP